MPIPALNKLPPDPSFVDLVNKLNQVIGELTNTLLSLDDVNFDRITARVIEVEELSALSANLGTITAGLMRAVTIIGSYIATREGAYPRAEMSNTDDLFAAFKDAQNFIKLHANLTGSPTLTFNSNGAMQALLGSVDGIGILFQLMFGSLTIRSFGNLGLHSTSGYVTVENWGKLLNSSNGMTLQEALNLKANNWIGGYTGFINTGAQTIGVQNGLITSVV